MPKMLYSVDVEAMEPDDLTLDHLHGIEKIPSRTMGQGIRLTARTPAQLFHYIDEHWDDVDYAAEVVYGDIGRRPFSAWDLAR